MKNFNLKTKNQKVIEVFENRKDYFIPNGQLGFSSYRQLVEVCIEYMLQNNLLIKRERTEQ